MSEPVVRDQFTRGEAIGAMVWLGIGACVSLLLEVVYLESYVGGVPMPLTILLAFGFNMVLTKTARLWSRGVLWVSCVPLAVWTLGFFALMFVLPLAGPHLVPDNILTLLLLLAGIMGGVWPVFRAK